MCNYEWKSIETAPKDGTAILLGSRGGSWIGKWLPVYVSGYQPENPWSSLMLNHDHMGEKLCKPTHWMPLPPPPTQAANSVPVAPFDDPKVQAVYAILCDDAEPPKGEHWEGFAARRIVDALSADSVLEDAARLDRERICAAIKAEDDYCVEHGDYMLDSDDCIKIVRGEWVRPDFSVDAARKQGVNHD